MYACRLSVGLNSELQKVVLKSTFNWTSKLLPEFIQITPAAVHEVNILDNIIFQPDSFYVVDRGYIDFSRLYTIHKAKIIIFLVVSLSSSWAAKCQMINCPQVMDTFYYVKLEILYKERYPVMMSGLGKADITSNLSIDNPDSLLSSFYRHFYYTPDDPVGSFKKMLFYCFGHTAASAYWSAHKSDMLVFTDRTEKKCIRKQIRLRSGEEAIITKVAIAGKFWKVSKSSPGLSHTSNERDISTIPNIHDCLLPFSINRYQKPRSW